MDRIQQILIKKYGEVAGKALYTKYVTIKSKSKI
jgi:hypothetical protein